MTSRTTENKKEGVTKTSGAKNGLKGKEPLAEKTATDVPRMMLEKEGSKTTEDWGIGGDPFARCKESKPPPERTKDDIEEEWVEVTSSNGAGVVLPDDFYHISEDTNGGSVDLDELSSGDGGMSIRESDAADMSEESDEQHSEEEEHIQNQLMIDDDSFFGRYYEENNAGSHESMYAGKLHAGENLLVGDCIVIYHGDDQEGNAVLEILDANNGREISPKKGHAPEDEKVIETADGKEIKIRNFANGNGRVHLFVEVE